MYDVVIIGAGPAGMAAGIYAGRAKLDTVMIEKEFPGGQVTKTNEVANYPGIADIFGGELAIRMQEHAKQYDIDPVIDEVIDVDFSSSIKKVITNEKTYEAKSVVIATGAKWRKLGIPGEKEFSGKGVSYCATCDGAFFGGKTTVVVGGGNTGVESAILLSRICEKVFLIETLEILRAEKILLDKLYSLPNVEILYSKRPVEIKGETSVTTLIYEDNNTKERSSLAVDGIFVSIGMTPNTEFLQGKVDMDGWGYILADDNCKTNIEGVYAAGDVREKRLRQIITASADGAICISNIEAYLLENF